MSIWDRGSILLEMKCQLIHFGNTSIQTSVIPIPKYLHHIVRREELENAPNKRYVQRCKLFWRVPRWWLKPRGLTSSFVPSYPFPSLPFTPSPPPPILSLSFIFVTRFERKVFWKEILRAVSMRSSSYPLGRSKKILFFYTNFQATSSDHRFQNLRTTKVFCILCIHTTFLMSHLQSDAAKSSRQTRNWMKLIGAEWSKPSLNFHPRHKELICYLHFDHCPCVFFVMGLHPTTSP